MRFLTSLCAFTLFSATLGTTQAAPVRQIVPQGATSFISKAGGFSLWLPVAPKQSKERIAIDASKSITSYDFEAETAAISYSIQAATIPGSTDINSSQAQLDAMHGIRIEKT